MTAPVLSMRHLFGVKSDVMSGLHYLDDETYIYVAGHTIVISTPSTRQQRFISCSDTSGASGVMEVCALAVSPNKRYLAIAERGIKHPLITIYDLRSLKKRRVLSSALTDLQSREYLSLVFAADNKHLLALGGGPDHCLAEWQWQKECITASMRFHAPPSSNTQTSTSGTTGGNAISSSSSASSSSISSSSLALALANGCTPYQASYNPTDSSMIVVTGQNLLLYACIDWDTNKIIPISHLGTGYLFSDSKPTTATNTTNTTTTTAAEPLTATATSSSASSAASPAITSHRRLPSSTSSSVSSSPRDHSLSLLNSADMDYTWHTWTRGETLIVATQAGRLLHYDTGKFVATIATQLPASSHHHSHPSSAHDRRRSSLTPNTLTITASSNSSFPHTPLNHASSSSSSSSSSASTSSSSSADSSLLPAIKCIESLASFTISEEHHGFVIGCDSGVVHTFSYNTITSTYLLSHSYQTDQHPCRMLSLAISPNQQQLVVATDTQQIFKLNHFYPQSNATALLAASAAAAAASALSAASNRSSLSVPVVNTRGSINSTGSIINTSGIAIDSRSGVFVTLDCSFHCGAITGVDVCTRKPLIVTCGVDRSIRLWNYLSLSLELCVYFPEQPLSVAFHPSGLHLLVGFTDKLRLINVLHSPNELRSYKELPIKNCSECCFSHGGHLFAAVNSTLIQVYHTYTAEQLCVFRGHTGGIRSVSFAADDQSVLSAGVDGAVYQRKLGATQRMQEYVQKGCRFTSCLLSEDERIYAVGDDGLLKEIGGKNVTKTLDAGCVLTQLVLNQHSPQRMLLAGTEHGVIRSFAFPLTGIVKDYQCHCKPVSRLRLTHDDQFVCSISDDGVLAIMNLREKDIDPTQPLPPGASSSLLLLGAPSTLPITIGSELSEGIPYSDEVLISRSCLDDHAALLIELKARVDELSASNDYQLRLHELNYSEKLKEMNEKYQLQMEHDRVKIEMIRDEKTELTSEYEEKLQAIQSQQMSHLQQIDVSQQKLIMQQVSLYQDAQDQLDGQLKHHQHCLASCTARHSSDMRALRDRMHSALDKQRSAVHAEQAALQRVHREYNETREQVEEDNDREIEEVKQAYEKRLLSERESTLRYKGENGIMKKKYTSQQKDIDEQKEQLKGMAEREEQLQQHIASIQVQMIAEKNEVKKKDQLISRADACIVSLKKDNQELEKFKFVLDHQIKQLKKQIEPREQQIMKIKQKVTAIDRELEYYHKENSKLRQQLQLYELMMSVKQKAVKLQQEQYRRSITQFNHLCMQLTEFLSLIDRPHMLIKAFNHFYHTKWPQQQQHQQAAAATRLITAGDASAAGDESSGCAGGSASASSSASPSSSSSASGFGSGSSCEEDDVDVDVSEEYTRQRVYLERAVAAMDVKLKSDHQHTSKQHMAVMHENIALIKEINRMRKYIKQQQQQHNNNNNNPSHQSRQLAQQQQQQQHKRLTGGASEHHLVHDNKHEDEEKEQSVVVLGGGSGGGGVGGGMVGALGGVIGSEEREWFSEASQVLALQRDQIDTLRQRIHDAKIARIFADSNNSSTRTSSITVVQPAAVEAAVPAFIAGKSSKRSSLDPLPATPPMPLL